MNTNIIIEEFQQIKKRGWIINNRKGATGVGYTFEKMLGIDENTLIFPDFFGYEIKTKRAIKNNYVTLFNCTPVGKSICETNRLRNQYGYPDYKNDKVLVMNISTYCNRRSKFSSFYENELFVNRDNKTISLLIYNKQHELIDWESYWTFDTLKERLYNKCLLTVLVKAERKYKNGKEYFRYTDIKIYRLKNFAAFVNLLEKGDIRISFRLGVYRQGKRKGKTHDHGTAFEIAEKNLTKLFDQIY